MVLSSNITTSLHRHLDGDRSLITILPELHRLTYDNTKRYPFVDPWARHHEQIVEWFLRDGVHSRIVEKFVLTTGVMQNQVTISKAAENFVLHKGRKGFKYCEVIIAPQYLVGGDYHCPKGEMNEKSVMDILINGIRNGEKRHKRESNHDIEVYLLFGIGREVEPEEAVRLVKIAGLCERHYVIGISLVCHEPNGPPEKFIEAFTLAHELGLKTACHVEWVKDRSESEKDTPEKIRRNFQEDLPLLLKNLRTAIFDLEVDRIDHGLGLAEDEELIKAVADKKIGVTICPGSLLATKLIDSIEMLKIRKLLDAGILVSLDADDDLFMPELNEIFQMYQEAYSRPPSAENLDRLKEDLEKLRLNAELSRFVK